MKDLWLTLKVMEDLLSYVEVLRILDVFLSHIDFVSLQRTSSIEFPMKPKLHSFDFPSRFKK